MLVLFNINKGSNLHPIDYLTKYCLKNGYKKPVFDFVRLDESHFLSQVTIFNDTSKQVYKSKGYHKNIRSAKYIAALECIKELGCISNIELEKAKQFVKSVPASEKDGLLFI